jgi:hypothetical protein
LIGRLPTNIKDALLSDPAKYIKAMKENRNYFTHYNEKQANNAARLGEVQMLAEKMKIILLVIIFQELGIPDSRVSNIILKKSIYLFNHLIRPQNDQSAE